MGWNMKDRWYKEKRRYKNSYFLKIDPSGIVHTKQKKNQNWMSDWLVMDKSMQELVWWHMDRAEYDRVFVITEGKWN